MSRLIAVALVLLSSPAFAVDTISANDLRCVVKVPKAYARNGPDGEWVAPVHRGDIFAPMEADGNWLHVQIERHIDGWVSDEMVTCTWAPKHH
jgi:hypothetical protein